MTYEVELKFPVPNLPAFAAKLAALGHAIDAPMDEVDLYFNHPSRDFTETDEAVRLRRRGATNLITYKGPKIDKATKTRQELELPLAPGESSFAQWKTMLEALGFRAVAEVHKTRRKSHFTWRGWPIEASLDEVRDAGTFVEFEVVCEKDQLDSARECILSLAKLFELTTSERRSYLELVLAKK